jgi:hypothetical protein
LAPDKAGIRHPDDHIIVTSPSEEEEPLKLRQRAKRRKDRDPMDKYQTDKYPMDKNTHARDAECARGLHDKTLDMSGRREDRVPTAPAVRVH